MAGTRGYTKRWQRILPWIISISALVYVFGYATDWERLVEATRQANLPLFVLVASLDKLVFFFIWAWLQAEALNRLVTPVPRRTVLSIRAGSELFRAISNPLADAAFLLGISRLTGGRLDAIVTVALVPFVTHLVVLLLQLSVTLPFLPVGSNGNEFVVMTAILGWSVLGLIVLGLRFAPAGRMPGVARALAWLERIPIRQLMPFIVWFAVLAVFDVAIQGVATRAFGTPIPWIVLAGRIPLLYLALAVPSVGNFGVREFTWAELYAGYGDRDALIAYAFATNAIFLVWNVLIGVFFLRRAIALVGEVRRTRKSGEAVPEPMLHDALDG
ncbi:MAG: hypothetical protein GY723_08385 [bacterium]|nr:hypothetical protein [bacterium]MCP5066677.1 hypothetical protein [bacterium]